MKPVTFLAASLLTSALCAAPPALADSLHIAYLIPWEGPAGTIGHIYWASGGWTFEQPTLQANAPAARSDSHLSGYFQVDYTQNPPITSQHIFYIDVSNHVHELSQVNAFVFTEPWTHNDIFQEAANNPSSTSPIVSPAAGTALAAYVTSDNTHHVIYIGDDSHVHELRYDVQNGWKHNDATQLTSGALRTQSAGSLCYWMAPTSFWTVFYIGEDYHVHQLYYDYAASPPSFWPDFNVSTWAEFNPSSVLPVTLPANGSFLGVFAQSDGSAAVAYLGDDSDVHLLAWDGADAQWRHTDITQSAVNNPRNPGTFPNPAVGSALAFSPGVNWDGFGQDVAYIGGDGHVHDLRWDGAFNAWTHMDLAGIPSGTALGAAVVQLDGDYALSEHVVYIGNDNQVYDLMLQEKFGSWRDYNLTQSATATVPIPNSALAIYVGPAW